MKVILRADVADVGHKGDVLDVADGFARNYLVPRGLAMAASKGALSQAEAMRRARAVRDAHDRESAPKCTLVRVATPEGILIKPVTTKFIRSLRGSLKGKGVMKAMMEDRKAEREL